MSVRPYTAALSSVKMCVICMSASLQDINAVVVKHIMCGSLASFVWPAANMSKQNFHHLSHSFACVRSSPQQWHISISWRHVTAVLVYILVSAKPLQRMLWTSFTVNMWPHGWVYCTNRKWNLFQSGLAGSVKFSHKFGILLVTISCKTELYMYIYKVPTTYVYCGKCGLAQRGYTRRFEISSLAKVMY